MDLNLGLNKENEKCNTLSIDKGDKYERKTRKNAETTD